MDSAVKTVLFIAGTQQGKSATIDEIYNLIVAKRPSEHPELAEKADRVPKIGDGCVSCTDKVTPLVAVPVPKITVAPWPEKGTPLEKKVQELVRKNAKDMESFTAGKSTTQFTAEVSDRLWEIREMQKSDDTFDPAEAIKIEPKQSWLFRGIDTPGMNDSQGRDDEFIEDIIETLAGKDGVSVPQTVNAFVFIVKNNQAFDMGWQNSVKRYWDQFPQFRGNWIFIHTMMDPFAEYTGTTNSYEEHCLLRAKMLKDALMACLEPHKDAELYIPQAEHFYFENKNGRGKAAKFRRWERATTIQHFLHAVERKPGVKSNEIKFRKTGQASSTDTMLRASISTANNTVKSTLEAFKHGVQQSAISGLANANLRVITEQNALEDANLFLSNNDTGDEIRTNAATAHSEWCWGGHSNEWSLKGPDCDWRSEFYKNDNYPYGECTNDGSQRGSAGEIAKFKLESPIMRGYCFTICVKAYKRDVYRQQVELYRKNKEAAEKLLAQAKRDVDEYQQKVANAGDKVQTLMRHIEIYDECAPLVAQPEFTMRTWLGLKPFYQLFTNPEPKCLSDDSSFDEANMNMVMRELYVAKTALDKEKDFKQVWAELKHSWPFDQN